MEAMEQLEAVEDKISLIDKYRRQREVVCDAYEGRANAELSWCLSAYRRILSDVMESLWSEKFRLFMLTLELELRSIKQTLKEIRSMEQNLKAEDVTHMKEDVASSTT